MKILRNRKNIVNWNEWKDKNRLETVREDMDKLGKPWVPEEELKLECNKSIKFEIQEENLNKEFSMAEFNRALKRARVKSAAGLDGIKYRMLKELSESFKQELLKIFNECWKKEENIRIMERIWSFLYR